MKYIPAEKLIAEIERRKIRTERRLDNIVPIKRKDTMDEEQVARIELRDKVDKAYLNGVWITLIDILSFIDSLQQEQRFPRWIHANYSDKPEIRHSPSGEPYLQSGAYMIWLSDLEILPKDGTDLTNHGQEQPELYLEKAARNVYESWMGGTMDDVRRDMVELGKVLNARKEETK